uniref:C3H1-type domain-containing protein n=1 Tax=Clastoptera arizonana TaxID=38151 RepID=A0A1B6CGW6_9HEMI
MLPSKGYFCKITCPYYKSNNCKRYHCHFQHKVKGSIENSFSSISYKPTPIISPPIKHHDKWQIDYNYDLISSVNQSVNRNEFSNLNKTIDNLLTKIENVDTHKYLCKKNKIKKQDHPEITSDLPESYYESKDKKSQILDEETFKKSNREDFCSKKFIDEEKHVKRKSKSKKKRSKYCQQKPLHVQSSPINKNSEETNSKYINFERTLSSKHKNLSKQKQKYHSVGIIQTKRRKKILDIKKSIVNRDFKSIDSKNENTSPPQTIVIIDSDDSVDSNEIEKLPEEPAAVLSEGSTLPVPAVKHRIAHIPCTSLIQSNIRRYNIVNPFFVMKNRYSLLGNSEGKK